MSETQVKISIKPASTQVILIGASQFSDKKLLPLPAVENNIRELKNLLINSNIVGIPVDNITEIVNEPFGTDVLSELISKVKVFDTLIFYYVGHGVTGKDKKGIYLATENTQHAMPEFNTTSFDQIWEVFTDIRLLKAKHLIFILDCCFSGRAISDLQRIGNRKFFILTATDFATKAEAPVGATYTAFTGELISILSKGIDNGGNTLALGEIYDNLKKRLSDKNFPEPQYLDYKDIYKLNIAYNMTNRLGILVSVKKSVKIIFYPESHKYKNNDFVKEFTQKVFGTNYEFQDFKYKASDKIVNLLTKKDDKTVYIEFKINEESSQKELRIFGFNWFDSEADDGYFVHTEELTQDAAVLKNEWADKTRYENITFFNPDKIMDVFSSANINQAISDISAQQKIYKVVLAYTYFGIFYLIIPYDGNQRTQYYLYDLKTNRQVVDTGRIADVEYSKISIHDALQTSIGELDKLKLAKFFEKEATEPRPAPLPTKPHLVFLYPEPIDDSLGYNFHSLIKGFQKYDIEIDCLYLSEDNLTALDKYSYIFIFTKIVKNKLCIENENLTKKFVSIAYFFEEFLWIDHNITKGLFIFTSQEIDFSEVVTDKPIANFVCEPQELNKMMKNPIPHALFHKQQLNENRFCSQCLNIKSKQLEKFGRAKHPVKPNEFKTALPELIDRKVIQNFVGREIDQEKLIDRIFKLEETAQVLNIKGAGGLGKTTIAKKITLHLADRGYFKDGIAFVACENFTDYGSFEAKVAAGFDMDKVTNLREHLKHYPRFDKLIILDNFETLLTLEEQADIEATKDLVNFICDYAAIVITSRQVIGYEFEDVYELSQFSTDNALTLFSQLYYQNRDLSLEEQKFLRTEILEELLDNNPLAIKIIAKNLPRSKELKDRKKELEQDFFKITNTELEEIFDKEADVNIERTRSLYHCINYSYQQLNDKEKLAFELLHLFPDGIKLEEFKRCFSRSSKDENKSESVNQITDKQIISLENKSLLENSNKLKLQSIVSRFAEYQFNQRTQGEKARYFEDAYAFNRFLVSSLETSKLKKGRSYVVSLFDSMSNNILKSLDYINQFDGNIEEKLYYIYNFHENILDANQIIKLTNKIYLLHDFPPFKKKLTLLVSHRLEVNVELPKKSASTCF